MNYIIKDYSTNTNEIQFLLEEFDLKLGDPRFSEILNRHIKILDDDKFNRIKKLQNTAIIIDDDIHSISQIIWFLSFNKFIENTICFDSIFAFQEVLNCLQKHHILFTNLDFDLGSEPIKILEDTSKIYSSLKQIFKDTPILGYTNYESSGHPDSNADTKKLISLFNENLDSVFDKRNIDNKDAYNNIVRDKIRISELSKSKRQLEKKITNLNYELIKSKASQKKHQYLKNKKVNILLRENIIGKSDKIMEVLFYIEQFSKNNTPILITGERGVGKEGVAKGIHRLDKKRCIKELISHDCGRDEIPESTFFGSEKGSYTGSVGQTKGLFEQADKSVLFLDEIGNLSSKNQKILLRVLEEKKFTRVGGEKELRSDFRLVCATNKDLDKMVKEGKFEPDLLDRIKGFKINVPPLRDRKIDIELLLNHFLKNEKNISFDEQAIKALSLYDFPGNVRELKSTIKSILTFFESGEVVRKEDVIHELQKRGWSSKEVNSKALVITNKILEIVESEELKLKFTQADIAKHWPNKKNGRVGISRDVFVTDYYGKYKDEIINIIAFDTIKYEALISKCSWIRRHI